MQRYVFKDLSFVDKKDKLMVVFLRYFYFYIDKKDLEKIGKFKFGKNFIEFDASEKKASKFYEYINRGLEQDLKSTITGKPANYIHQGTHIPLIGNSAFGIVDRGSNLIEVKPMTGCNLKCIYCSVDQDKRIRDFLIEKDYLVEELKKVVDIKGNDVEIHIGTHGEPALYTPLVDLIRTIRKISKVKRVSMDTNATILSEKIVDDLVNAGLTRFNLSINSINSKLAKKIAGGHYSVNHALEIAKYISKKKGVELTIAPVWLKGINDDEIEKLVLLGQKLNAKLGIQNFMRYKFGKNPVKEVSMDKFYDKLRDLEKKTDVKLILSAKDFDIKHDKSLEKPFKKGDVVEAEVVCIGTLPKEILAKSKDRTISVYDCNKKIEKKIKIKIVRSKHNIYSGLIV